MKVAVYNRVLNPGHVQYIVTFLDKLKKNGFEPILFEKFYTALKEVDPLLGKFDVFSKHKEIANNIEYIFSLGGDGTLLDTVTLVRDSNIPIVGINLGRLGFLSSIGQEEIDQAIKALIDKNYIVDSRSLIHLDSNKPLFAQTPYGLNDFTIHKKDTSSMIQIHAYLNGEFLNSYWADGLIVATPTGSTGYSLSCGGPIISPTSNSFVITPVAPHNLNVRPIIVSDDSVVSFEIEGRSKNLMCSLDSRFIAIDYSFQLAVRKESFTIKMVRLAGRNFLSTLRDKLAWGADKRN